MTKFDCQHCGQSISAPDELAGTQATCPTCEGELNIPGPTATQKSRRKRGFLAPLEALPLPLQAIIGACVFLLLGAAGFPGVYDFWDAASVALGQLLFQGFLAVVVGSLYGLIMVAFKKPFAASLLRGFSLSLVVMSVLWALGRALLPLPPP